jgi:hypothetical protein
MCLEDLQEKTYFIDGTVLNEKRIDRVFGEIGVGSGYT